MTGHRHNRLVITTPEGCRFSLLLAGPVSRFMAWLIDLVVVIAAGIGIWRLLGEVLAFLAALLGEFVLAMLLLLNFVLWFGYGIALEWLWNGRTVGKRVLGLRVVDEHGLRLTFSQVVLRNLLRLVDMLPMLYLVAGVSCMLSRRCQRLGDIAAGTVVIRSPRIGRPDLRDVLQGKFNSLRAHPHLEARLRNRVSPAEARVAAAALLRRDSLEPEARVSLFAELAEHFREVVRFPEAATDGLSDEQYVRNVVDSLYRARKGT